MASNVCANGNAKAGCHKLDVLFSSFPQVFGSLHDIDIVEFWDTVNRYVNPNLFNIVEEERPQRRFAIGDDLDD